MSHLPKKNATAFELEFSQQDQSATRWSSEYKYAVRGVSLQYQNFGNKEVLGDGYSIYAHSAIPIYQGERFGFLDFRVGTGLAFITKKYDVESNLKNNAIGSHLNGFVNLKFQWNKYFEKWHFGLGLELSHYSNAAMTVPNLGLNIPSVMVNLGYTIKRRQVYVPHKIEEENSDYSSRMADELRIFLIGGSKQNPVKFKPAKSRPVIAVQGLYSKQIGNKWKVDMGLDIIYNDGNRHHQDTAVYKIGETMQFGAYVGASIHMYRAEFMLGIGAYLWSPVKPFGWVYNRLGFRYHFSPKFSGTIAIKAHLGIADYLEFGIGYKLWSKS